MVDQKYYENYFSLFITEGWKQYIQDVTEQYESIDLANAKSWDEFLVLKTTKQYFKNVINFEAMLKLHYDNNQELDNNAV